jgi:hypothetical protein
MLLANPGILNSPKSRAIPSAWSAKKDCARALKMSYSNVLGAFYRLRKRDLTRYCIECNRPTLFNGVCVNCGAEREDPRIFTAAVHDSQSPTNWLHPGNLLGSETDYDRIGLVNQGFVLRRRIERGIEDPLIIAVKSVVEDALKRSFPSEITTDEAGRLAVKEVLEFKARYPGLASSKNVRKQLAQKVINRLRLLHPQLRPITRLPAEEEIA